jgi:hypothetical protein
MRVVPISALNVANTRIAAFLDAEAQLKDIVQNLYNLIVQSYDHRGSPTQDAMKREMYVCQIRILDSGKGTWG